MPKVRLKSGLTIHYQQTGQGPDLVMIHGLTGNLAIWHLNMIPRLWDHFRILTYDLRGHGYSEMPLSGYTAGDMATDLGELLDELGIECPLLVGHSYGADIALYFAFRHPQRVRKVLAIEAALPALMQLRSGEEWEGWTFWCDVLERAGHPVPPDRRTDMDFLLRTSLKMTKLWGPLNGFSRNPKPYLRLIDTTTIAGDYQVIGELTLDNIPRIQTPVLLIYGENSAFVGSYDYLRAHLPRVESVLLPKADMGHFGPLEQPDLVADYVLAAAGDAPVPVSLPAGKETR